MDLKNIFYTYRTGDKRIINQLFAIGVEKTRYFEDYINSFSEIQDKKLDNIVKDIYYTYIKPYKKPKGSKCPKYFEAIYCGSLNDMRADAMMIFLKMTEDKSFNPETSGEIYSEFEYRLKEYLGSIVETSAYSVPESEITNGEFDLLDLIPSKIHKDKRTGDYFGVFQEIADIVNTCDIKNLLRDDAKTQQNIVDLIRKYYVPTYNEKLDTCVYPRQKDMIYYYQQEYGESISQSQYSNALEAILKSICQCVTSLKGKPVRRSWFTKDNTEEDSENDI